MLLQKSRKVLADKCSNVQERYHNHGDANKAEWGLKNRECYSPEQSAMKKEKKTLVLSKNKLFDMHVKIWYKLHVKVTSLLITANPLTVSICLLIQLTSSNTPLERCLVKCLT